MRILVIDDHPLFCAGLIAAVQAHTQSLNAPVQLASATNLQEGLDLAVQFGPDVVLLDYHLPDTSGLQLLQMFASRFPWTARVVMSADERPELIAAARANGASGFMPKTHTVDKVWQGLQCIAQGKEWWPSDVPRLTSVAGFSNLLTSRQAQVLRFIDEGCSNSDIAKLLSVTERTVKQHVSDLLAKTATSSRESLLRSARTRGWLL
jgi:DNA-binding NarL/FixJ family response regulator